MDYLIPTAMEVPEWETGYTVTPSPHHPLGAKGIGESATVGSPPAIVNAVRRAHPVRRSPHGHAVHAGAGVGRHARKGGTPAMMAVRAEAREMERLAAERQPFVSGDRRTRPPSDECSARATGRSCCATERSRASSAASAPSPRCVCTPLRALETGEPLLLRLVPGDDTIPPTQGAPAEHMEGAVVEHNPCLSGGSLEIFLQPHLPANRVVVVGSSPIARSIVCARASGRVRLLAGLGGRRRGHWRGSRPSWWPRTAAGRSRSSSRRSRPEFPMWRSWPVPSVASPFARRWRSRLSSPRSCTPLRVSISARARRTRSRSRSSAEMVAVQHAHPGSSADPRRALDHAGGRGRSRRPSRGSP